MRRASLVTVLVTVLSLGITDASAAGPTPVKVLDPPGVQLQPFRSDQWFLFTSNAPATPNHLNAFAQNVTTHARIKLNATGQRSGDLLPYAAESMRRSQLLDQAAEELRKRLRQ